MSTVYMPEIVAPAGSADMLTAVVRSGANAVYIGLQEFSARANAQNFKTENLHEIVGYCHARGVRVFVALNTLLSGGELPQACEYIRAVAQSGADAIIVQDMGVAQLVRHIAPSLALHASTQCTAVTAAGALMLKRLGFARVVMGREAGLQQLTDACAAGVDIEVFVHGALCFCVSGSCYLSAFFGGRSANRGSCASPCRLNYTYKGKQGALLSLKDLCLLPDKQQLARAGVAAFKIEGRLRTPEYAASAVEATLREVFSHGGFTRGYIDGVPAADIFGSRTDADFSRSKKALPQVRALYRTERQSVAVDIELTLTEDSLTLTATSGDVSVSAQKQVETQPTQNDQTQPLNKALCKTGGTPFYVQNITLNLRQNTFVPSGEVATLRAELLAELLCRLSEPKPHPVTDYKLPPTVRRTPQKQGVVIRVADIGQLAKLDTDAFDSIILSAAQVQQLPEELKHKAIAELPRLCSEGDEPVRKLIAQAVASGVERFSVGNISHLLLCEGYEMHGGFALNITNHVAARYYRQLGLASVTVSPETACADFADFDEGTTAIAYGRLPLMLFASCPLGGDCESCERHIIDRKGKRLDIVCEYGMRELLNPIPIYMGDRKREMPTDTLTLYFTTEDAQRVSEVVGRFLRGDSYDEQYTRGLYY